MRPPTPLRPFQTEARGARSGERRLTAQSLAQETCKRVVSPRMRPTSQRSPDVEVLHLRVVTPTTVKTGTWTTPV